MLKQLHEWVMIGFLKLLKKLWNKLWLPAIWALKIHLRKLEIEQQFLQRKQDHFIMKSTLTNFLTQHCTSLSKYQSKKILNLKSMVELLLQISHFRTSKPVKEWSLPTSSPNLLPGCAINKASFSCSVPATSTKPSEAI